jgi:hypothetical protein
MNTTLSPGFDVSTASYVDSFSVSAQETEPRGIAFNADGTKDVYRWANRRCRKRVQLSTGFSVSTSTFVDAFSISAQESIPTGLTFNTNGTKMFIIGQSGDDVNEYSLTTGFDVSTASYTQAFSVSAQETSPTGLTFNTNGSKMFIVGQQNDTVYEYTVGSTYYINQMDKTQLDAVTDPNHIALGDDLDLAIIFNMTSGTTVPSSDGVAINYDANCVEQRRCLGY